MDLPGLNIKRTVYLHDDGGQEDEEEYVGCQGDHAHVQQEEEHSNNFSKQKHVIQD